MSKFKSGDYVVPVRAMRTEDSVVQTLDKQVGKVLQVLDIWPSINAPVLAGKQGGKAWFWHPAELRLAAAEEIEAATKPKSPKPLKRGDLVKYLGEVWVVTTGTVPTDMFSQISTLTGKERMRWVKPDAVVRLGAIRKKVKKLKQEIES